VLKIIGRKSNPQIPQTNAAVPKLSFLGSFFSLNSDPRFGFLLLPYI